MSKCVLLLPTANLELILLLIILLYTGLIVTAEVILRITDAYGGWSWRFMHANPFLAITHIPCFAYFTVSRCTTEPDFYREISRRITIATKLLYNLMIPRDTRDTTEKRVYRNLRFNFEIQIWDLNLILNFQTWLWDSTLNFNMKIQL